MTQEMRNGKEDKPFVNVKLDYGFKWFFGQLKRKHVLIRYLNAIFKRAGHDIVVNDVEYHDKEILPSTSEGKRIVYDIYCSSPEGHHFIVEMQNVYEPFFEDRIIFYTMRISAEQGFPGWDYNLDPVFSVVVANFNIKDLPKQLFHRIVMYDTETQTVFSDKVNVFLICLPSLPKRWKDCKGEFERLTYLIDRMGDLNKDSEEYNDMEYHDFIKAAEKTNMSDKEYVLYSESEQKEADIRRGIAWAEQQAEERGIAKGMAQGLEKGMKKGMAQGMAQGIEKGMAQGMEKGMEKGMAKGKLSEALEIAKRLLSMRMDLKSISQACGIEISQLEQLAAGM